MAGKNDGDFGKATAPQALRERVEDKIAENEQETMAILDSLVEHVVHQDRELRILWANKAACESVHMKREDLIGRYCYEVWAGRQNPCEDCPVTKAHETDQPQMVEKMTPDGRWWYIQALPVRDSNDRITSITEVTLDITERKQAEDILRKAKDSLEIRVKERTAELFEANKRLRQEIEERKAAEEYLQETKNLLSNTFNALEDLVVVIDKDLRIRMSNWKDHDYISQEDRLNNPYCYEVLMHRKKPCNPCHVMDVFATGKIKQLEVTNPIDGKVRDTRLFPVFDEQGNVATVIGHLRDISQRKNAEAQITRLASVIEQATESIIITDPEGNIIYVNPFFEKLTGYKKYEVLGQNPRLLKSEEQSREFYEKLWATITSGESWHGTFINKKKDGSLYHEEATIFPVRNARGQIINYAAVKRNITERVHAEEALRQSQKELKLLSSRLIMTQEEERKRIAWELHDGLGQSLAAMKFSVENTLQHLNEGDTGTARRFLEALISMVQHTSREVRRISMDLRPAMLDNLGIVSTISWFCREFKTIYSEISIRENINIEESEIPISIKTSIFRILQEAFHNITKHSKANLVQITLGKSRGTIELIIEDDGVGFDTEDVFRRYPFKNALGLATMKERARLAGGTLSLVSAVGHGTTLKASWPCREDHGN